MSMFSQHGSYNPSKYCMRIYPLLTSISLISTILGTILVVFRNFLPFIPPQFKETGSLRGTFFTHEATSIQKLKMPLFKFGALQMWKQKGLSSHQLH